MSNNGGARRVVLFADPLGLEQLLAVPELVSCVVGLVAAEKRSQYISELKRTAAGLGIVFLVQPDQKSAAFDEFQNCLQQLKADLFLSHSYSMLIPKSILRVVDHNAINVHWSLLPKNRGANPLQWAIIKGETQTGVTLHYMTENMDAGDIIAQTVIAIMPDETWVELRTRLQEYSQKILRDVIPQILSGQNNRVPQDEDQATTNFRLDVSFPEIKFESMSDVDVYRLIRAQVAPLKGAYLRSKDRIMHFDHKLDLKKIAELREKYGIF